MVLCYMKEEIRKILSRNAVIMFFAIVIIAAVIFEDVTKTPISKLYIILPALYILGECIRQIIHKK